MMELLIITGRVVEEEHNGLTMPVQVVEKRWRAAGAYRNRVRGTNSNGPPESLNAPTGSADYDGADAGVNTGGGGGGGGGVEETVETVEAV